MLNRNGLRIIEKKENKIKKEIPETSISLNRNEEQDLMVLIKSGKYNDIFLPLNIKSIIDMKKIILQECNIDFFPIKGNLLNVLKLFAHFKNALGTDRKFYPNKNDSVIIILSAIIYDVAYLKQEYPETILIKLFPKFDRTEYSTIFSEVEKIIKIVEYSRIDYTNIIDELDHYDPKIKYVRILKEQPKLDILFKNIFNEINEKNLLPFARDFENGTRFLNLVKKMGLKYINSRSNLEWFLYSKSLKKIRNFMSRHKYLNFLRVIKEELELYKKNLLITNFNKNENLYYLELVINKLYEQRNKKGI